MNDGPSSWMDTITIDGKTKTIVEYLEDLEMEEGRSISANEAEFIMNDLRKKGLSTKQKSLQKRQGSKRKEKKGKNSKVHKYSIHEKRKYAEEKGGVVMTQIETVWKEIVRLNKEDGKNEFLISDIEKGVKLLKPAISNSVRKFESAGLLTPLVQVPFKGNPQKYRLAGRAEYFSSEEVKEKCNALTRKSKLIEKIELEEKKAAIPVGTGESILGQMLESTAQPIIPENINVTININVRFMFGEK